MCKDKLGYIPSETELNDALSEQLFLTSKDNPKLLVSDQGNQPSKEIHLTLSEGQKTILTDLVTAAQQTEREYIEWLFNIEQQIYNKLNSKCTQHRLEMVNRVKTNMNHFMKGELQKSSLQIQDEQDPGLVKALGEYLDYVNS